jgi:GNAT superfamily N-acetyltransferase
VTGVVRIVAVPYSHPDAALLVEEVQQEYVVRYGGRDATPVDPAEFAPPKGLFLVAYIGEVPGGAVGGAARSAAVACGGWRSHGAAAEIKRMYVRQSARRTGLARALLAELERTALVAGHTQMILETGSKQPEAVALYRSAGYTEVPPFGYYAEAQLSLHLGKQLAGD